MTKGSTKQKKAFEILHERIKKHQAPIMGEIMIEAGYSKEMSKHPGVLVKSKAWRKMETAWDRKYNSWKFGG